MRFISSGMCSCRTGHKAGRSSRRWWQRRPLRAPKHDPERAAHGSREVQDGDDRSDEDADDAIGGTCSASLCVVFLPQRSDEGCAHFRDDRHHGERRTRQGEGATTGSPSRKQVRKRQRAYSKLVGCTKAVRGTLVFLIPETIGYVKEVLPATGLQHRSGDRTAVTTSAMQDEGFVLRDLREVVVQFVERDVHRAHDMLRFELVFLRTSKTNGFRAYRAARSPPQ